MKLKQIKRFDYALTSRIWSQWFLGIVFVVTLLVFVLNLAMDPLQIYRPNKFAPLQASARYQNAGRLRSCNWNGLIAGTSLSMNFSPKVAEEVFGGDFINISMAGSAIAEQTIVLEFAHTVREPENVIWGVDIFSMAKPDGRGSWRDQLPLYLYNQSFWDDSPYLFSATTAGQSWVVLKNRLTNHPVTLDPDMYNNWHSRVRYSPEAVWRNYAHFADMLGVVDRYTFERFKENFDRHIKPLLSAHTDTEFNIILLPYSLPYCAALEKIHSGVWMEWKKMKIYMLEMKSHCPNLHLYDFQNRFEWIKDYSKYMDTVHFHQEYSDIILREMKSEMETSSNDVNQWYSDLISELNALQIPDTDTL